MPIENFSGNTFVAFIDISGFKEMMKNNIAIDVLNRFYQSGYRNLSHNDNVNGFFISDSGVLFVRNNSIIPNNQLSSLLTVVESINRELLSYNVMLTTSISYGQFSYQQRIEFTGIEKNPIFGNAYISALLDNENGKPKLNPGQCRLIKRNLPENFFINNVPLRLREDKNHFYYYWMVNEDSQIDEFNREYTNSYNLKYFGMLKALKSYQNNG